MAKKQSRRSVSLNKAEFETAQRIAESCGVSLSHFTEVALRALIQAGPTPSMFAERVIADFGDGSDGAATFDGLSKPHDPAVATQIHDLAKRIRPEIDDLIARSSIGEGIDNIKKNGVSAEADRAADELAGLDAETWAAIRGDDVHGMAGHPEPVDDIRVEYDE